MLLEFTKKCDEFGCETEVVEKDLSVDTLDRKFDGIISSMTIHHVEDQKALFSKFYDMLNEGGFIAIADLDDSEDGSFHSDNTGVFHHGFNREALEKVAKEAGFKDIRFDLANTISKPHREFTVFLMTAVKQYEVSVAWYLLWCTDLVSHRPQRYIYLVSGSTSRPHWLYTARIYL